ncbi:hypothetical protein [Rothia sp. CCM 9416]|uniref:hypothetical protein n=1 Tax=Rothia sp. CCM 9416 TaxID=3402655 RepID=UPI003AE63EBB
MSSTDHRQSGQEDFEDWDAVFEDSESTRLLSPSQHHYTDRLEEDTRPLETSTYQQEILSATRSGQAPYPVGRQQAHPATAQLPLPHQQTEAGWDHEVAPLPSARVAVYRRIQFLPAMSGSLVAYALSTGLFALVRTVFTAVGISTYSSLTGGALAVSVASSQGQAIPWVVASALIWLLSFGWAGYVATRMAAVAPIRQALGVLAVSFLATLLATLVTWASAWLPSPLTPSFAFQRLLAPDLALGALTALAAGLLAAIGSMLGAALGMRYRRALTSINS